MSLLHSHNLTPILEIPTPMLDTAFATMDAVYARVKADHADLIKGIHAMYAQLIELRYLRQDEVLYPPHGQGGKPGLAIKQMQRIGFNPEVIALLGMLPYPSNEVLEKFSHQEEGLPLAPDSAIVSYLEGQPRSTMEWARKPSPNGETCIPPWAFKFATAGGGFGTNYIYDTRDQICVRWDSASQFSEYWEQPSRPTGESMNLLMNEMTTLDWLPWRIENSDTTHINIHRRPHMSQQHMSCLGATNRYNASDEEEILEQPSSEFVVLKEVLDDRKQEDPALEKALNAAQKKNGGLTVQALRQCATDHGIHLSETALSKAIEAHAAATAHEMVDLPATLGPPQEFATAWMLQEVDKLGGMTTELKKALYSHCSDQDPLNAHDVRAVAIKHGLNVPEMSKFPMELQVCFKAERVNRRLEYAKAVQNVYLWKRNLYESCGWPNNFRGDEFEERRASLQSELFDLMEILGPQGMRVQNMEQGRYLREWYRQKAGPLAV